jgi:peptide/nickel transport system permease protein
MRNNLLDELAKPYVVTARAKGVRPWRLIMKYPVRVAINPLISTVGYLLPALVSGSVIVSVVLSLPTIGPVLLRSIQDEDIYLAGFLVLVLGVLTVVGTLVSDILLAVVDPRIRFSGR